MTAWIELGMPWSMHPDEVTAEFYRRNQAWLDEWKAAGRPADKNHSASLRCETAWLNAERVRLEELLFYRSSWCRPGTLIEVQDPARGKFFYVLGGNVGDEHSDSEAPGDPRAVVTRVAALNLSIVDPES